MAGGTGIPRSHGEAASKASLGAGPASVAGRQEVPGGAGGAHGRARAHLAPVGAPNAYPIHYGDAKPTLQARECLITDLTILWTLHTQASRCGQHIAARAFAAHVLIAALGAAKRTQDAVTELGVVVVGGVGAHLGA